MGAAKVLNAAPLVDIAGALLPKDVRVADVVPEVGTNARVTETGRWLAQLRRAAASITCGIKNSSRTTIVEGGRLGRRLPGMASAREIKSAPPFSFLILLLL